MGKKEPKSKSGPPFPGKVPREKVETDSDGKPVWRLARLDFKGPWCPTQITAEELVEVTRKLGQIETQRWAEIDGSGNSHNVAVDKLIKEAQERLMEIHLDDLEVLYSLRLTGIQRLWGIRERNVFRALWWDPAHQICPSVKKHT